VKPRGDPLADGRKRLGLRRGQRVKRPEPVFERVHPVDEHRVHVGVEIQRTTSVSVDPSAFVVRTRALDALAAELR
jgi:hypothetical protein